MATAREGNVLLPPGTGAKAEVKGDELLASYVKFTQKGVTLKGGPTVGVLETGTVLARDSVSKKYVKYVSGGPNGTGEIKGLLRNPVDLSEGDRLGNIVVSGVVKRSKVVAANGGSTAGATVATAVATALNGREDLDTDWLYI